VSVFTFGETMGLISADGIGPLPYARGFTYGIGGSESNTAIGIARLGGHVTWLGRVGRDATGALIAHRLRAEGVHTRAIADDAFTGLMVKHRRSGEVMHVDYHRTGSAGSRLAPGDLPADLAGASILHVTGITPALSASARATVFQAVETARARGVTVSVDVNYRAKLWSRFDAAPVLRELVTRADLVFAGPDEAALIAGSADGVLDELAKLGPAEVVLKDGARGCTALIDGTRHEVPALPVTVVDPVGAGDAFVAGYLADREAGADPARRLATATAAGAFQVTVPGDCEGLPTRADLASLPLGDVRR
jgi:2-dehydro-3-deoxygluconokinase